MWHDMFHLGLPIGEKIIRSVVVYAFLVVALRLAGKREMAQLNSLDFVVLLAVANAVQNGIIGNDNSVTGGLMGAATLFVVNGLLAWLLFRNRRVRRIVEGSPTVLVEHGVVLDDALRHEHLTMDDLLVAVQRDGAEDLGEVDSVVLEPNGVIVTRQKTPDYEMQHYLDLKAELAQLRALLEPRPG